MRIPSNNYYTRAPVPIQCIRGSRSAVGKGAKQLLPPIDLVMSEANLET